MVEKFREIVFFPVKLLIGLAIVLPALFLPYRARTVYFYCVATLFHLPYRFFGALAGYLLKVLREKK